MSNSSKTIVTGSVSPPLLSKLPGKWVGNLFVPDILRTEALPWMPFVTSLCALFSDQKFAITSVFSVMDGKLRGRNSSHFKGFSIDIGPQFSDALIKPDGSSPRMADNRALAVFLANQPLPVAVFMEGDHFHIDLRWKPGLYVSSTYRKSYSTDSENWETLQELPSASRPMRVFPDGTIFHVSQEDFIPNPTPILPPPDVAARMKDPSYPALTY